MLDPAVITEGQLQAAGRFVRRLTPRWNKYMRPPLFNGRRTIHAKQHLFLLLDDVLEILYGGAGGGGKTIALLLCALQYVDVPGYSALILRRTFKELSKAGAIMDRAQEILMGTDAEWSGQEKCFYFPTGPGNKPSRLQFGYLESEVDKYQYQSAEFHTIIFEELTEFLESQYTFLFSRLRRSGNIDVPLRMRAASNPGGVGHEWVKARFPVCRSPGPNDPIFIPAKLADNPSIDQESYLRSLSYMLPVDRARIRDGNWDVTEGGKVIHRDWFANHFIDARPRDTAMMIRFWDLAISKDRTNKRTAGVKMGRTYGNMYFVEHAVADWWNVGERDNMIKTFAETDGKRVKIGIEEEPGSGGIAQNNAIVKMLHGWPAESMKVTGDKLVRAGPFASQCEAGNVKLVRGDWVQAYLSELHAAEEGAQLLDQLDASSGGFNWLSVQSLKRMGKSSIPDDDWQAEFGKRYGGPQAGDDWRNRI